MPARQSFRNRTRKGLAWLACALAADPVAAVRAAGWRMLGKRVRARNQIAWAAAQHPAYYAFWVRHVEPGVNALPGGAGTAAAADGLNIVIWHDRGGGPGHDAPLAADLAALVRAEAASAGDAARAVQALAAGPQPDWRHIWVLPLPAQTQLAAATRAWIGAAIASHPDAGLLYWDEDRLCGGKRADPWLKPDWDELVYLARGGLDGACMVRGDLLLRALTAPGAADPEAAAPGAVLAQVVSTLDHRRIVHVPRILSHRAPAADDPAAAARHRAEVQPRWPDLDRVEPADPAAGTPDRAVFALPDPLPGVSIIIPTRDQAALLRACVAGVDLTRYAGTIELIVVDNGSTDPEAQGLLRDLAGRGVRVLRHDRPFNFSAINNMAVLAASEPFVCLLNNDVEVIGPDWLSHLMRHAVRPATGAVGALLLYPDGTVQHAGVVIGKGDAAGHVYRGLDPAAAGHRAMHRTTRHVSALTAACMVMRRDRYLEVGGMDEDQFKVAFNDVDLSLKLMDAGYRNVFVAEAVLIHHESKSRGSDALPANRERFARELAALRQAWNTATATDPYHHPLFLRSCEQAVLSP